MAARLAHASLARMPQAQSALWAAVVVVGCAGLSAVLIAILRPILMRHLLAHPNDRSSHKIATPQGAGLGVMAAVFAGCALGLVLWMHGAEPKLLGLLLAAAGLTLLGAIDARARSPCGHASSAKSSLASSWSARCPRISGCFPT